MQLGHYQTSAGASPNLYSTRFDFYDGLLKCSCDTSLPTLIIFANICAVEIQWADKTCPPSSRASHTFKWWGSPHRCMLGSVVSLRWIQWKNPSCYRGWCLPPTCWAFTVRFKFSSLFIYFRPFFYWHLLMKVEMLFTFSVSSHPSPTVLIPALRTVGNIVTGDDMQTQVLVIPLFSYLSLPFTIPRLFILLFGSSSMVLVTSS